MAIPRRNIKTIKKWNEDKRELKKKKYSKLENKNNEDLYYESRLCIESRMEPFSE